MTKGLHRRVDTLPTLATLKKDPATNTNKTTTPHHYWLNHSILFVHGPVMVKPLRSFFFCVCVLFGRLLNVYFFSLSTPSLWSSPSTSFCVAIGEKSLGGWTQELLFFSFCAMMIPFPVSQSDRESGALDLNNKIGADPKWPSSLRLYRPLDRIASFITCH